MYLGSNYYKWRLLIQTKHVFQTEEPKKSPWTQYEPLTPSGSFYPPKEPLIATYFWKKKTMPFRHQLAKYTNLANLPQLLNQY